MAVAPRWRRAGQHLGDDLMEHVFDRIIERNRRTAVRRSDLHFASDGRRTSPSWQPAEPVNAHSVWFRLGGRTRPRPWAASALGCGLACARRPSPAAPTCRP